MKKTLLALTALTIGLLLPLSVNAVIFSAGPRDLGASSHESSEDSAQVSAVVTPATNTGDGACFEVLHEHWHTNTSTNTSSRYFRAAIYATAIALDDDFMDNIDTSNMVCTNGDNIGVDCSFDKDTTALGTVVYNSNSDSSNTDTWNGTTITYETLSWISGDPVGLVWRYGQDDDTDITLLPWLSPGHSKEEDILFVPENFDHVQTATTESWTKLEFFYIDPDVFDDRDGDGDGEGSYSLSDFHEIYPSSVSSDGSTDDEGVDPDGDYIFWYGINDIEETDWDVCGEAITCESLSISPETGDLDVGDVFSDVPFTVTATGSDGSDITADSTFQYYVNKYDATNPVGDGVFNTSADADGTLRYGFLGLSTSRSPNTTDSTVSFTDTEPGDSVYVYVSDYDGAAYPDCYAEVELPYCIDLDITDPTGFFGSGNLGIFNGTSFNTNITVDADASSGEDWLYSITYSSYDDTGALDSSTFDGNSNPYTTDDYTIDDYDNTDSAEVEVGLDDENGDGESDDVAGLCSDSFNYSLIPPLNTCVDLTFSTTGPISEEDMEAGDVEISWTSTMSDGTATPPPYFCIAINNPSGSFRDATGMTGTGNITTSVTTVYYTGEPGDIVMCSSSIYPTCIDTLTSEEGTTEVYACTDTTLSDPYIVEADGSHTTLDLTDDTDVTTLFDNTTVCYDYSVTVSSAAFSDTLQAAGYEDSTRAAYSGNLQLTVNETGGSSVGNPATAAITGFTSYTGTVCWENYQPGNYLNLQVLGNPLACYDDSQLPTPTPPTEEYVCTDLELSPDSVVMGITATDAGTQTVTVVVTGSDALWSGNLFVTKTGSGTLYYTDGSASTAGDGHLEIPVSGVSTTVSLTYVGGVAGDVVTAYIDGEVGACTDNFTITQETIPTEGSGSGSGTSGSGTSGSGTSSSSSEICDITVTEESSDTILSCEDYQVNICVEGDDVTVTSSDDNEICYYLDEDGDGNQDSDEAETCEDGSVDLDQDDDCYEVTVNEVCEDTVVTITDESTGEFCEDYSVETTGEVGEFNKYIYTFNFSAEKNSYSDEGVFFAHDEDRAFYTLEYTPSGDENQIVFTDDMWTGDLISDETGGEVSLATSYSELTSGNAYGTTYDYATITAFGFGATHELHSDDLADYVDSNYNSSSFMSYVPYIKYDDDSESSPIDECTYDTNDDGSRGDLTSTEVCYDPEESPDGTEQVVIENAGTVDDGTIRIRYVGVVVSNLDCSSTTDTCLTEEFENNAEVDAFPGSSIDEIQEASARLVVLCAYLLTENAGDVYLNEAIEGGSDLACITTESTGGSDYSGYSNTDSLIIVDPDATSSTSSTTGTTADYAGSTISYCDDTNDGSLIGNLSSYVCEIIGSVSDLWRTVTVETTTESHVSQSVRNAETGQTSATMSFPASSGAAGNWDDLVAALSNTNNEDSHILYFDGTYGGATRGTLTLSSIEVPDGAWTLIVENADLVIAGDVSYATSTDYSNIPSIAFVVQNGDIHFENSSYHNVGVYYTNQDFDGDTDGTSRSPVNQQLTIDGSVYGNVQPLIDDCRYVAPPTTEGGGLVVRYDSRILLNTPPSLSEYVDVSTEKAIN